MAKLKKHERILGLIEVLQKYTDEERELKIRDIIEYLHMELGVEDEEFQEMTISRDLKDLEKSRLIDLIINTEGEGFPKYYSIKNRLFEIQELRLLMDAISSARFIPKKDKERIVGKIKQLTSTQLAKRLENQVLIEDNAIYEAKRVNYHIFKLHHAIQERKAIEFIYGRYNVEKEFVLSNEGKPRVLHPYALIWHNDYYYLIGKYEEKDTLVHLRVDRMTNIDVTDETYKKDEYFDVSDYVKRVFHMFTGVEKDLKVRFDNGLINVIIDRFGKNVSIEKDGENTFILRTKAIISDGLVGWLLTWGSKAQVIDPPELLQRMRDESKQLHKAYHGENRP